MGRNTIKFGNKQLSVALHKYGEDVIDEIKRIIFNTAYRIHAEALSLAPYDEGNLKGSIEVEILNGGLTAVVRVTANYAVWIEYGTGIYAVEGNGRKTPWTYYSTKLGRFVSTQGMKPQPFWHPSIDVGERYFKSEMRKLGR